MTLPDCDTLCAELDDDVRVPDGDGVAHADGRREMLGDALSDAVTDTDNTCDDEADDEPCVLSEGVAELDRVTLGDADPVRECDAELDCVEHPDGEGDTVGDLLTLNNAVIDRVATGLREGDSDGVVDVAGVGDTAGVHERAGDALADTLPDSQGVVDAEELV